MSTKYDFRNFMNIRAATSPSFSYDGKHIVFLTNITGTPQVWKVSIKDGWPEQLTYYDERVTNVLHSPTEDRLTFAIDVGGSERDQIYLLSPKTGITTSLAIEPDVIHSLGPWSCDGRKISFSSNSRHRAFFDIYVAEVSSMKLERVLENDGTNSAEAWSHDGKRILIKRQNTNLDSDLYLAELETEAVECLTSHKGEASYSSPIFTNDDKSILCLTNRGREFTALVSIDVKTKEEKLIAEESWEIDDLDLSPEGRKIAYTTNYEGYSRLKIRDLSNGDIEEVEGPPLGVISEIEWSSNGRLLAFTFSGSRFNSDIWLYNVGRKETIQLTKSDKGGIPPETFVEPELIHFKTFDNLNVPAFLYMPKTSKDSRPPVVINVHGGPESQSRATFNSVTQYLVNQGFAVFSPNVRGSTGYGKKYVHLDDVYKRIDSVKDVRYAHKWLTESGKVDSRCIGIYGGSYGGFMVLAALTTYPELWAAGVDLYGVANFMTFLKNTGPWRRHLRIAEYGDPVRDEEFLKEISPINKVDRIVAPLLVVHGVNDPRVPKSETDQIVKALKKKGVTVKYIVFNDEGHGIVKLNNRLTAYSAIVDFLRDHLASGN